MDVKFEIVRIGSKRKDSAAELLIRQNLNFLRVGIRHVLQNLEPANDNSRLDMVLVIPEEGVDVKIVLDNLASPHIAELLKTRYPNNIFEGDYKLILATKA
ncbi:hypothetical protein [Mangrovimonas sp. TPBH4]|uniref:hypothetical protein n=1 Tax=Mangrovimonas sp. TPBH4 TaxID=1645914 RepID=UPI0006B477F9|nr:hypothetical protein [Mangrovimonas sp. TPBH4]